MCETQNYFLLKKHLMEERLDPSNRIYYFNSTTLESTYDRPKSIPSPPTKEVVIEAREIGEGWSIGLTNKDHELFFKGAISSWDIPEEICGLVGDLINEHNVFTESDSDDAIAPVTLPDEEVVVVPEAIIERVRDPSDNLGIDDSVVLNDGKEEIKIPAKVKRPAEELRKEFLTLLVESDASPFSTLEITMKNIDSEILREIDMKDLRKYFTEWASEEGPIRQKNKKVKTTDPKEAYKELLTEHVKSFRMRFVDFTRRHKKDSRYRNFDKQQEAFDEYLIELRRSDLLKKRNI